MKKMKNPCQKGYTAYGFKIKDGARVPNCVPLKEENIQELSIKKKIQAKISRAFSLDSPMYRPTRINPQTGEQSGARQQGDYARAKMYRREKYAEKQKAEKMASANSSATSLTQKVKEELGHDNEWGRPQLTKKMLKVTPGQKTKISSFKEYHIPELEMSTVQYHDVLNPAVWDGFDIKPDIAKALIKVAHAFIESWKLDIPVKDVILTGSNANYNWTEFSDFDLHVVVDIHSIPVMYQPFVISLLKSKKELFNSQHKIQIKGYKVEVYAQDVNDTLYATGIYSLLDQRWVKEPMLLRPDFEHPTIQSRANEILQDIDDAIDMKDKARLMDLLAQISQTRKTALTTGGELNTDNLVFKVIRNSGAIQKIRDVLNTLYDQELTLESDAWQRKEGKNPEGGLNSKGIKSYRKSHPGSHLSLAVTTKPSKLKADSKSANRRKSFCARMQGMKKRLTSKKTANDPDSRINKSLRKWNCH
jgi:hypothetical protein